LSLRFTFLTTTHKPGRTNVLIHSAGPLKLELEEVGGVWLMASRARLGAVPGCRRAKPRTCRPHSRVLLFVVGELEAGGPTAIGLPIPSAVEHAGGREKAEFEIGKVAAAQSGCLACHRIGDAGNRGPGSNLTRIGFALTERQIAHALVDPREPMPSFRNLPAQRFHDLVRFLALLR